MTTQRSVLPQLTFAMLSALSDYVVGANLSAEVVSRRRQCADADDTKRIEVGFLNAAFKIKRGARAPIITLGKLDGSDLLTHISLYYHCSLFIVAALRRCSSRNNTPTKVSILQLSCFCNNYHVLLVGRTFVSLQPYI